MRKRVFRTITASVSCGVFKTQDEAIREANAIKGYLKRLCEKHGYNITARIGVSVNSAKCGEITTEQTGKRGRPKKVFAPNGKANQTPAVTEPHLHIWIEGEGSSSVIKSLSEHLNRKYKKQVVWHKSCDNYVDNAKKYLDKQCIAVRELDTRTDRKR